MDCDEFMECVLGSDASAIEPAKVLLNLDRKVKEAKLWATLFMLNTLSKDDVTYSMGKILLCGEKADEYYDLISAFLQFLDKPRTSLDFVNPLVTKMDQFCSRVTEDEYCHLVRTIMFRGYMAGDLYSWCAVFNLLILECYQRGMQSCGWAGTRVSLLSRFNLTLLELVVVVLGSYEIGPASKNKLIHAISFVRDKDLKAVKSLLAVVNCADTKLVENFVSATKDFFKVIRLADLFYATVYSSITNMFSPTLKQNVCVCSLSGLIGKNLRKET